MATPNPKIMIATSNPNTNGGRQIVPKKEKITMTGHGPHYTTSTSTEARAPNPTKSRFPAATSTSMTGRVPTSTYIPYHTTNSTPPEAKAPKPMKRKSFAATGTLKAGQVYGPYYTTVTTPAANAPKPAKRKSPAATTVPYHTTSTPPAAIAPKPTKRESPAPPTVTFVTGPIPTSTYVPYYTTYIPSAANTPNATNSKSPAPPTITFMTGLVPTSTYFPYYTPPAANAPKATKSKSPASPAVTFMTGHVPTSTYIPYYTTSTLPPPAAIAPKPTMSKCPTATGAFITGLVPTSTPRAAKAPKPTKSKSPSATGSTFMIGHAPTSTYVPYYPTSTSTPPVANAPKPIKSKYPSATGSTFMPGQVSHHTTSSSLTANAPKPTERKSPAAASIFMIGQVPDHTTSNPDGGVNLACPTLGGSTTYPGPSRVTTSRKPTMIDLSCEDPKKTKTVTENSPWLPNTHVKTEKQNSRLEKNNSSNVHVKLEKKDNSSINLNNLSSKCFCSICFDIKEDSEMFRGTVCKHTFCADCISKHAAAKIQQNVLKVNCPIPDCGLELEPEHLNPILPKEVVVRWESARCESMIAGLQKNYCPFKDCSVLLVDDGGEVVTSAECPSCHRLFCAQCRVPWHAGMNCKEFLKTERVKGEEDSDRKFLDLAKSNMWQKCPKCNFYVQRSSGCEHMKCRCGCNFCYHCGKDWKYGHICNS